MSKMREMLGEYQIPPVAKVIQSFDDTRLNDPEQALWQRLEQKQLAIHPGDRIAITGGSRGIAEYQPLMKTIVDFVRSKGGNPFVVPAMGSHGGATAQGQVEMLEHLGITERTVGAPIVSSMEVVEIGRTEIGLPVYIDKNAYEADGIILLNRVKTHTSIRGDNESGLVKMCAIGLAKHKGAAMTHSLGVKSLGENIIRVGRVALKNLNIVCGVATIENGYNQLADVYVVGAEHLIEEEKEILKRARAMVPTILLPEIDALVVLEQGKDISGTGMDPSVVGRPINKRPNMGTEVEALGVLRLTEISGGNACGCGMADFISQGLRNQMKEEFMQINATTGMIPMLAKIPITLETEKLVVQGCIRASGQIVTEKVKLVFIRSTKYLEEVYMSKAAFESAPDTGRLKRASDYFPVPFDSSGRLLLFD